MSADIGERALSDWCREHLGAPVTGRVLTTGHPVRVYGLGLRLADGREVVLKVRVEDEARRDMSVVPGRLRVRNDGL